MTDCGGAKQILMGIDEVGRGPLAGPLVIGAVVLGEPADWHAELKDSKKLSPKKRARLATQILAEADAVGLGWVSAAEIDMIGLGPALRLAARRAAREVLRQEAYFSEIIIDGPENFLSGTPLGEFVTPVIKADARFKAVSAASIVAKEARDDYMHELAQIYPEYGFEAHVGYGTKKHLEAMQEYGVTPEHRRTVRPVAKVVGVPCSKRVSPVSLSRSNGAIAEGAAADFLQDSGHYILARNHKTPFYEIDIVSIFEDCLYFTEVKYRKDGTGDAHGAPLEMVTAKKRQQMKFAAESFLRYQPSLAKTLTPQLAVAAVGGPDFEVLDWFALSE